MEVCKEVGVGGAMTMVVCSGRVAIQVGSYFLADKMSIIFFGDAYKLNYVYGKVYIIYSIAGM